MCIVESMGTEIFEAQLYDKCLNFLKIVGIFFPINLFKKKSYCYVLLRTAC